MMLFLLLVSTFVCCWKVTTCQNFIFRQPATGPGRVCRGGTANFSCQIVNTNNITQPNEWRFANNTPIPESTPDHTLVTDDLTSFVTDLIVTNIVMSTSYICGPSSRPQVMSEEPINVEGPPIPVGIIITKECLSTVALWNVTSDPVCGSVSYDLTITSSTEEMMMTITDNSYYFSEASTLVVTGINNAGLGHRFNATMISVAGPPSNVIFGIDEECTEYFILSWYLDSDNMECGSVSYDVTIAPSGSPMRITESTYNFTGLTPNSSYTINVTGINNAGVGESSINAMDTLTMEEAVPNAVRDFRNNAPTPNSVTVEWDIPVSNGFCGNEILHYQLVISSDPDEIITVYQLEHTFSNLRRNTTHIITVAAVNRAGVGMTNNLTINTTSSPGGGDDKCFDKTWCIIVVVLCCILGFSCVISCTSSSFIFICLRREEDSTTTINIFMVTIGILSFGTAIPVWYIYDNCIRNKEDKDSSKDKRCFNILSIGSCGFIYILNLLFDRPSKIKDRDAPDSQNMPLQHKDTNKPVRSAAEEQSLYSYARTGPINVVVEGGSSTRPGDKPRQT